MYVCLFHSKTVGGQTCVEVYGGNQCDPGLFGIPIPIPVNNGVQQVDITITIDPFITKCARVTVTNGPTSNCPSTAFG